MAERKRMAEIKRILREYREVVIAEGGRPVPFNGADVPMLQQGMAMLAKIATEAETELAEARAATIEECARVCEAQRWRGTVTQLDAAIEAIRALSQEDK